MGRSISSRGIEPIIASLMMLVITVGSFSMAYLFTNSWVSDQRSGTLTQLQERIVVEDVWFKRNVTGGYICVYVRNIGTVAATLNGLQVNGTTYPYAPSSLSLTTSGTSQSGWMNTTISWTAGRTYEILILTEKGSRFTTYAKPS